jgi:hypothetical protein
MGVVDRRWSGCGRRDASETWSEMWGEAERRAPMVRALQPCVPRRQAQARALVWRVRDDARIDDLSRQGRKEG